MERCLLPKLGCLGKRSAGYLCLAFKFNQQVLVDLIV